MALNPQLLKIIACPDHLNLDLLEDEDRGLICQVCGVAYPIIEQDGFFIPNMMKLSSEQQWVRGGRNVDSNVIEFLQGGNNKVPEKSLGTACVEIVLDIGCGASPRGTYNVDCYLPTKINKPFILANVEYLPFKRKSVDVVLSYYNIEHLTNPSAFIVKAADIASKRVKIVTDNSDWIGDIFFRIIGRGRIFHDEHYFKWSREYMQNLISRLGIRNATVVTSNLSTSLLVRAFSAFSILPRVGTVFNRDLIVEFES